MEFNSVCAGDFESQTIWSLVNTMPYKKDANGFYMTPGYKADKLIVKLLETVSKSSTDIDTCAALVFCSRTYEELSRLESSLYKKTFDKVLTLFNLEQAGRISEWEKLTGVRYSK